MDITTEGTGGPKLDERLLGLNNNIYGDVVGATDPAEVARAFVSLGWAARRSADDEFEVEHTWAELTIIPITPLNFSGVVDPPRAQELLEVFQAAGYQARAEIYDQSGKCVAVHE